MIASSLSSVTGQHLYFVSALVQPALLTATASYPSPSGGPLRYTLRITFGISRTHLLARVLLGVPFLRLVTLYPHSSYPKFGVFMAQAITAKLLTFRTLNRSKFRYQGMRPSRVNVLQ
ncbi:hypothetical protein BJV74DRAFT_843184 [Russula compacta]|nr:hypothetical protein BJV74DRAFT_843184 [Russula compacta]